MSDGSDNPFVLWEPGTNMWIVLKLSKIKYSWTFIIYQIKFCVLGNMYERNIVVLKINLITTDQRVK